MSMTDNVMRMRPLKDGLVIPPGETVTLQPGGIHVMGLDLTGSYKAGQTVKGTLVFEKAGKVDIEYAVRPIGAEGGGHDHKH
jgi:copper(I)-binding protein